LLSPLPPCPSEPWIYPTDFSTAVARETIAAQMDHPSASDRIRIMTNAVPAPNRRPKPCADADRWGSSNVQSVGSRITPATMRSVLSRFQPLMSRALRLRKAYPSAKRCRPRPATAFGEDTLSFGTEGDHSEHVS